MIGKSGNRGAIGKTGETGDSGCLPSQKISSSNNMFSNLFNHKLSITTFDDGLSLNYNNNYTGLFSYKNLHSNKSLYLEKDSSVSGTYKLLLHDLDNNRKLYLSVSRQPLNQLTEDYFPPSDYMGLFTENSGIPLIISGTPQKCLIEIDFQGTRYALVKEQRDGIGQSIEDGQYALIFRRNGIPTPLQIQKINKYQSNNNISDTDISDIDISDIDISDIDISNNTILDIANNKKKPIYQYHNSRKDDYLYTNDVKEVPSGYNYQGLSFKISDKYHNDSIPLYLCHNKEYDKHFLSNDSKCIDGYNGHKNNRLIKRLGYLHQTSGSSKDNQGLKRCYNQGLKTYMTYPETMIRNCQNLGFDLDKHLGFIE